MIILSELDDCFKKGLLRKIPPSKEGALKSMERARSWLKQARLVLQTKSFDSCLLVAYEAMFHSARALLIKDGVREKSHYCVIRYVHETYVKSGKLDEKMTELLDRYRELRHDAAYDVNFNATMDEATDAIEKADQIISIVEKLVR